MEKQPVGQLPDLTQSNNDDEIMVITNDEYNQLKKEKISDFITDLQSTNTNNSLTTGSDGKLFVSKTINASDVDGVLSLDNIPQLTTNKLPETGISADNYSYPSSITVNDRGQVVSIVEGSAAEAGAYLDQSQLSNCILSLTEGSITPKSYNNVSFVNHGATYQSDTLSNFSASNFAILAKTMSNATAWTFTIPFTTGADVSGKQTIVAINNKDNCVIIDNGAIALVYNGTELKGDVGLSANTAYVLEFIRTTTGYTVNVKQNETIIDTISVLSTAGFFGGKTVFLGNDQSGNYFKGSIGLATSSIYEGSTKYWQYGDDIDCQTVEVKGNFQLLMPNGRNADQTLKNVEQTISLDSLILYSPNGTGKTVLVTEDNELMARDSYVESYTQPNNPALNSIWYDKTDNKLKQQLSSTTTDFASFVGAKIGKIEDNGTDITSATLDVPLTIAKDIDVVHNTGDETIEGKKDFLDRVQIVQGGNVALRLVDNTDAVLNAPTTNAIKFFNSKISAVPTTASTIGSMLANKITWELNGGGEYARISPYFNAINNLGIGFELFRKIGSTTYTTALQCGIRPNGQDYMNFPKCNARPTTTSSAGTSNVDVIVKNYYSGTSGYVQFGSGLKIQWGRVSGSGQRTATLPSSFATSNYALSVTLFSEHNRNANATIKTISTSNFSFFAEDPVIYTAIGY